MMSNDVEMRNGISVNLIPLPPYMAKICLFKFIIISPSFESLTIILGWENGHSSIISFTLRSFSVRMTIEWQKRHFKMTQNDRDGLGMRKIKIISMENVPHSNIIQVIPTSFWVEWHLYDYDFKQSNFCHIGMHGYQLYLANLCWSSWNLSNSAELNRI